MAQWNSLNAIAEYVEEVLLKDDSQSEILKEGWLLSLLDDGHTLDELVPFIESIFLVAVRITTNTNVSKFEDFLRDIHAQHERSTPQSGVCGYMFKANDIAWNCRTCQMDDTCVLCQTCFQNSDHTGHEVFFHRTSPGGMCDCGDIEAWKQEGFCKDHTGGSSTSPILVFPKPIERTVRSILCELVRFMAFVAQNSMDSFDDFKMMEKGELKKRKHVEKFPSDTNPRIFHARISNDDVHTDEDLISCLVGKRFPFAFAEEFTHSVDSNGCGMLKTDVTLTEALICMREMSEATWFASLVDNDHLKQEATWELLFSYLLTLLQASTTVQALLFEQLFTKFSSQVYHLEKIPLVVLLQATPHLKKPLARGMRQLYLAIMGSKELKSQFSPLFTKAYPRLMMQYFGGIGTERENIFGLGVQIFTTPSIVHQLEEDLGLWETVLTTLQEGLSLSKVHYNKDDTRFICNVSHMAIKYRRYYPLLLDINHLLMIPNMSERFATIHARLFLDILNDVSHMNLQTRVPEDQPHVERENNAAWVSSFTLSMHLDGLVLPNMYKALRSHEDVSVFFPYFNALYDALQEFQKNANLIYGSNGIIQYNIANSPVSFHYPLHQAWGRFILETLHRDIFSMVERRLKEDIYLVDTLLEFPLRNLIFSSQIASNMWVRNGKDMMVRQVTSYYSLSSNFSFRDLDLITIQNCILLIGTKKFIKILFERYNILNNILNEKKLLYISEFFLKLLWISIELPPPIENIFNYLRRDVLHMLIVKPHVFSYIREQTIPIYSFPGLELINDENKNRQLLNILNEIADSFNTSDMSPLKYKLKLKYYNEYDPSYYHISPVNHVEAQVKRQEIIFKNWKPENNNFIPFINNLPIGNKNLLLCRFLLFEIELFDFILFCLNDSLIQNDEIIFSRIIHILTAQLYIIQENNSNLNHLIEQITKGPPNSKETDGIKRQKIHSTESLIIHNQSILIHLTNRINQYKLNSENASKILWSGCLYILKKYIELNSIIEKYFENNIFFKKNNENKLNEKEKILEIQRKRQQDIMARMMKQQLNFASQLNENDEINDDNLSIPECIICSQLKNNDSIVYVGLILKTSFRFKSTGIQPIEHGNKLYLQLCGHAVHLTCVEQYRDTIRREYQPGMIQNPIAFDPENGEFLCPLCKSLCNTCLPYISYPRTETIKMENFFQNNFNINYMIEWFDIDLPIEIDNKFMEISNNNNNAIKLFTTSINGNNNLFDGINTICNTFHMNQLQGISLAFSQLKYDNNLTLNSRLGINLLNNYEKYIDLFGQRDNFKMNIIFMTLKELNNSYLNKNILNKLKNTIYGIENSIYLFNKSLLKHDLFFILLFLSSILNEKSSILWTIRFFSILYQIQVLIQCMQPIENLNENYINTSESISILNARNLISNECGLKISKNAPNGLLLVGLFETNCNEFLRKSILLVRALLGGWNDPDSSIYLNYSSSLHLSTNYKELTNQLGIPTIDIIMEEKNNKKLFQYIKKYINQIKTPKEIPKLNYLDINGFIFAPHVPIVHLPLLYTDLYTSTATTLCPRTGIVQESPAICLLCNTIVCGGSKCCKIIERGACSQHVPSCGCGNGVFFLTRQCQMLLVSTGGRSCFFGSPYVDEYGEEDYEVRRGRPLYLRTNRYMKVLEILFSHSIASEVSKNRRTSEQYIRPNFY